MREERGAQSSKHITFENITMWLRLCVHIFSNISPPWKAVLHDAKSQIKSCALFLNLGIASNWDLTVHPNHSHVHHVSEVSGWNLLISPRDGFSLWVSSDYIPSLFSGLLRLFWTVMPSMQPSESFQGF